MSFMAPERFRVRSGPLASDAEDGNNGAFYFPAAVGDKRPDLTVIASDGEGWEHVSVSTKHRCPTWEEMCFIKDQFWDEEDAVMQIHPPRSDYVNMHPFCLHLWRPTDGAIPLPHHLLVGFKDTKVRV